MRWRLPGVLSGDGADLSPELCVKALREPFDVASEAGDVSAASCGSADGLVCVHQLLNVTEAVCQGGERLRRHLR